MKAAIKIENENIVKIISQWPSIWRRNVASAAISMKMAAAKSKTMKEAELSAAKTSASA